MHIVDAFAQPAMLTVRRSTVANVQGRAVTTSETLTVQAAYWPAEGYVLMLLPEGKRERGAYQVFTQAALRTVSAKNGYAADQVLIGGEWWEVHSVKPWAGAADLSTYEVLVTRVNEP